MAGTTEPGIYRSRRNLLRASVGLAATTTAGCAGRTINLGEGNDPVQVSLTIKTMPEDADPYSIRIAQHLAANLNKVGIKPSVIPIRRDEFYRSVLLDQSFDLYVGRHPGMRDPDGLYPLLHSAFTGEPGWQNPFGFADRVIDALLERQRQQSGNRRRRTVYELQRGIARKQPYSVIAIPDMISATRTGVFDDARPLPTPLDYLAVSRAIERETGKPGNRASAGERHPFRVTFGNRWITRNLNPIAVDYRGRGIVTGLLYDPLVRIYNGETCPWLVEQIQWIGPSDEGNTVAHVTLRESLSWHDDTDLTPDDVVFTYRFLHDTVQSEDGRIPTPRYRGLTTLVESVRIVGNRQLRLEFTTPNRAVAVRGLTVPILPRHEWEPRRESVNSAAVPSGETSEALVWGNMNPVGSGPLEFQQAITDDSLVLDRFDDHFLHRDGRNNLPDQIAAGFALDRLAFRIVPSDAAGLQLIESDQADVTGTSVNAAAVPDIVRSSALQLRLGRQPTFYHVGYNLRRAPLADPRFRRAVARLIDAETLIQNGFRGYAVPATSPLALSGWLPPDLEWVGHDPVHQFAGDGDGLDVSRARSAFEHAGYRFTQNGKLIVGN